MRIRLYALRLREARKRIHVWVVWKDPDSDTGEMTLDMPETILPVKFR